MDASIEKPVMMIPYDQEKRGIQAMNRTPILISASALPQHYSADVRDLILNNVPSRGYKPTGGREDYVHDDFSAVIYQCAYESINERFRATLDNMEDDLKRLHELTNLFATSDKAYKEILERMKVPRKVISDLKAAGMSWYLNFEACSVRDSMNRSLPKGLHFRNELENILRGIPTPKEALPKTSARRIVRLV